MSLYAIAGLEVERGSGDQRFRLSVPALTIARGASLALVGPSGCGKSSLLDVLALLAVPSRVERFSFRPRAGEAVQNLELRSGRRDSSALAALRRRHIGYVPQVGGLLAALTVRQNVDLPRRLLGLAEDGTTAHLLDLLGLTRHGDKKPAALSVGERQRVAIARALVHRPDVVAADEPTAALDPYSSDAVMEVFTTAVREVGCTLLVVSHEVERVKRFGFDLLPQSFAQDRHGMVSVFG